jgi:hypothetical protein
MAYQTGTASDQTDLMSKLSTFAQANGYTQDYYNGTNRHLSLSRASDSVYVSFAWDGVDYIGMFQALGYSVTHDEEPWNQVDDSGNGNSNFDTNPDRGRQVSAIGNGSFTAYHFFAYTSPSYAIHVVLEFAPGLYRHFGFGKMSKVGTWTGGAWCGGHLWNPAGSTPYNIYDNPAAQGHTVLTDGYMLPGQSYYGVHNNDAGATLYCTGLPGQAAASKWGHCVHHTTTDVNLGTDRGSNARVRISGGFRAGPALQQFGHYLPSLANGFIPIIPIEVFYMREVGGDSGVYYLGRIPNVGHIHLHGIDPAQELTVGSDTWIAFPMVRKSNAGGNNQESWNAGIIYKKVT